MNKFLIIVLCAVIAAVVFVATSTSTVEAVNWNSAAPSHLAVNWNS